MNTIDQKNYQKMQIKKSLLLLKVTLMIYCLKSDCLKKKQKKYVKRKMK